MAARTRRDEGLFSKFHAQEAAREKIPVSEKCTLRASLLFLSFAFHVSSSKRRFPKICESKEGGEICNATPRGTAKGAMSRNFNEDRKSRAARRAGVKTRKWPEAMYLPAFSRVGARFSRGASRATRAVLGFTLGARMKSASRARPRRGSAGANVTLSIAGTTRARRLPGGIRERKKAFHQKSNK